MSIYKHCKVMHVTVSQELNNWFWTASLQVYKIKYWIHVETYG